MKRLILFSLLFTLTITLYPQSKVLENCGMKSMLLKTEVNYSIYLPDGYEHGERHCPVGSTGKGFLSMCP